MLFLNYFVCAGYACLNEIAVMLEEPFGAEHNNWPLHVQHWKIGHEIEGISFMCSPRDFAGFEGFPETVPPELSAPPPADVDSSSPPGGSPDVTDASSPDTSTLATAADAPSSDASPAMADATSESAQVVRAAGELEDLLIAQTQALRGRRSAQQDDFRTLQRQMERLESLCNLDKGSDCDSQSPRSQAGTHPGELEPECEPTTGHTSAPGGEQVPADLPDIRALLVKSLLVNKKLRALLAANRLPDDISEALPILEQHFAPRAGVTVQGGGCEPASCGLSCMPAPCKT